MMYQIKTILEEKELEKCPIFYVDQFNWGGKYRPISYGQFAYLKNQGFLLKMTCEETNPVCNYSRHFEPVWMDSAMEGFFSFDKNSPNYVNLEVNSAGAVVASIGDSKTDRKNLTYEEVSSLHCKATSNEKSWSIELLISLNLIKKYFYISEFHSGDCIKLNFFKIAEGDTTTHFASYAPINYPTPNFHLPEFFAEGLLL